MKRMGKRTEDAEILAIVAATFGVSISNHRRSLVVVMALPSVAAVKWSLPLS